MTNSVLKRKKHIIFFIISIIISLAIMTLIFCFSAQDSSNSNNTSSSFSEALIKFLSPFTPKFIISFIKIYIRKIAHFVAYFSLGVTLSLSMKEWLILYRHDAQHKFHYYIIPFAIAFFYACSDEFHQYFVPGRSGKFTDILLDSAGSALGVLITWAIIAFGCYKQRKS